MNVNSASDATTEDHVVKRKIHMLRKHKMMLFETQIRNGASEGSASHAIKLSLTCKTKDASKHKVEMVHGRGLPDMQSNSASHAKPKMLRNIK